MIQVETVADAVLIGVPIYMFWDVKLPRKQRRMIISIFAANAISSAASVALLVVLQITNDNTRLAWACVIVLLLHLKVCSLIENRG